VDEELDPFTPETLGDLQVAASALAVALREHAEAISLLDAGNSNMPSLIALNDTVRSLMLNWNEAVFAATGTMVSLGDSFNDEADWDNSEESEQGSAGLLTLVCRFDLVVEEAETLEKAGRAVDHDLDEASGPDSLRKEIMAVKALLNASGEPLPALPGVEMVGGVRLYMSGAEELIDVEDAFDLANAQVIFSESWH
jgi:hypothetical protein